MTSTNHLEGSLISLRPLALSDSGSLFEHTGNDLELWQWLRYETPTTLSEMEDIVSSILIEVSNQTREAFAVILKSSGEAIGSTSFMDFSEDNSQVEVGGTFYAKKFWRTGVNTEAKILMLSEAFDVRQYLRVIFKTDKLNLRSQAAIERLGAKFDGVKEHHMQRLDGSWRDSAYYSIEKDRWPTIKKALSKA
jgi:RimJ/RimL family protein N-acetyltransferase